MTFAARTLANLATTYSTTMTAATSGLYDGYIDGTIGSLSPSDPLAVGTGTVYAIMDNGYATEHWLSIYGIGDVGVGWLKTYTIDGYDMMPSYSGYDYGSDVPGAATWKFSEIGIAASGSYAVVFSGG